MSNLVEGAYLFFASDDLHAFDGMLIYWSGFLKLFCITSLLFQILSSLSHCLPQVSMRVHRGVDRQPKSIKRLYHLQLL